MEWIVEYWIAVLFAGIISGFGYLYKRMARRMQENSKRQEAIEQGVVAILRDRLIAAYNHYMEKGFCPIYAMETITEMYMQYHALGGNGTVTGLLERIRELPTEKEDE